ncbi:MAG TPA: flagellar basal body P-ring protein FlgI [bacterium]|nr:flagellar basal body P-ring protein FlgI [bacterium]
MEDKFVIGTSSETRSQGFKARLCKRAAEPTSCSVALRASVFFALIVILVTNGATCAGMVRLKDIAQIQGMRSQQLIGYGLVIGLNGTGDASGTKFTTQSLANMLDRLGIRADATKIKVGNVAAIIATSTLPAFARSGSRLDVTVSSLGDASSLQGGTLLMTPLRGPDGKIYAVAQGPVSIGGFLAAGAGAKAQKNHPTVGRIPNGGTVERNLRATLEARSALTIKLDEEDFTTSARVAEAINEKFVGSARTLDAGAVEVSVPTELRNNIVEFISQLETVRVVPDSTARVVIDERTGTVVIGRDVQVDTIAIAHGNLNVVIKTEAEVSQPYPESAGQTVVTPQTTLKIDEEKQRLLLMSQAVTIQDVVAGLNAIGVSPRDLIAILQAIKAAGALRAELKII